MSLLHDPRVKRRLADYLLCELSAVPWAILSSVEPHAQSKPRSLTSRRETDFPSRDARRK